MGGIWRLLKKNRGEVKWNPGNCVGQHRGKVTGENGNFSRRKRNLSEKITEQSAAAELQAFRATSGGGGGSTKGEDLWLEHFTGENLTPAG